MSLIEYKNTSESNKIVTKIESNKIENRESNRIKKVTIETADADDGCHGGRYYAAMDGLVTRWCDFYDCNIRRDTRGPRRRRSLSVKRARFLVTETGSTSLGAELVP